MSTHLAYHAEPAHRGSGSSDTHADLNVPGSVREGALDWIGVAHMLGEPGAAATSSAWVARTAARP